MRRTRARNRWVNSCCFFCVCVFFVVCLHVENPVLCERKRERDNDENVFKASREAVIFQVSVVQQLSFKLYRGWTWKAVRNRQQNLIMFKFILQIRRCKELCTDLQQAVNYGTVLVIIHSSQSETKTVALSFEGRGCAAFDEHLGMVFFGVDPLGKPAGTSVGMGKRARHRILNGPGPLIQIF